MKAILTVIGQDINILDVSQTIMEDYFTMTMMLQLKQNSDFESMKKELNLVGDKLGVKINVQNEEIFNAMHKL